MSMNTYLLGIDVGTTGTKTLLFDSQDGALLGSAYRSYPISTPQLGRSEQNPDDWWKAIQETIHEVCEKAPVDNAGERVAAISLSLQGGTLVPVDKALNPTRPAIVWNDARAEEQKKEFLQKIGAKSADADTMYQRTGWHLGQGLPALLIRWIRENEPEVFEKTDYFLTVPGYVAMRMTGNPVTDLSDYGIDQLCDIRKEELDQEILDFCGIRKEQLAGIVHSGDVAGHLTEQAARELGLTTQTVLIAGAHDQYAVALGAGAMRNGDIVIGSGTAWVVTAIADAPDFESDLAQSVAAMPGMWGSIWSLSSGGVCLDWLRGNIGCGQDGKPLDYSVINEEAAKRCAAAGGLYFYPFSGLKKGHERFTKASLIGMDLSHDIYDIARAIMEGVAFQTVWMMESFRARPSKEGLKLAGGVSKSRLWCQIVADISGLPVRIPAVADLACVGAAILAGTGCGIFSDAVDGYSRLAIADQVLLPDPERVKEYARYYETYKKCAASLGEVYDQPR